MSTYNWLDLQTLESQPIMPKNLPDRWLRKFKEHVLHIGRDVYECNVYDNAHNIFISSPSKSALNARQIDGLI